VREDCHAHTHTNCGTETEKNLPESLHGLQHTPALELRHADLRSVTLVNGVRGDRDR
jgi:hypothetical protein